MMNFNLLMLFITW